jgi:hypothetical protein
MHERALGAARKQELAEDLRAAQQAHDAQDARQARDAQRIDHRHAGQQVEPAPAQEVAEAIRRLVQRVQEVAEEQHAHQVVGERQHRLLAGVQAVDAHRREHDQRQHAQREHEEQVGVRFPGLHGVPRLACSSQCRAAP